MLKPTNVMILSDIRPSKSGIEMQLQMLKARQHLENGGVVGLIAYESPIDIERYLGATPCKTHNEIYQEILDKVYNES